MSEPSVTPPAILVDPERMRTVARPARGRRLRDQAFRNLCRTVAGISVVLLTTLLAAIVVLGVQTLNRRFLASPPSPNAAEAGFFPAIMGSVWLLVLVALVALPVGVATAIILEEYVPRRPWLRRLHSVVQVNITNLAGVPSVVYGILGLTLFVSMFELFGNEAHPAVEVGVRYFDQFYNEADQVLLVPVAGPEAPETAAREGLVAQTVTGRRVPVNIIGENADWPLDPAVARRTLRDIDLPGRINERSWYYVRLPFGRGVLAGALTLALVILPVIIVASQEALRAVPGSFREASLGMGATRWQTIQKIVLPSALPGIMTGTIIALSRAVGEAAPLLMIAGIVFITNPPQHIMDDFTAMPLQIYNWAQRPQSEFHDLAASGIVVLLAVLLCFNAVAVGIRQKYQKSLS